MTMPGYFHDDPFPRWVRRLFWFAVGLTILLTATKRT